jgi:hypothetical protein
VCTRSGHALDQLAQEKSRFERGQGLGFQGIPTVQQQRVRLVRLVYDGLRAADRAETAFAYSGVSGASEE